MMPEGKSRLAILVVGMHRSGTSALAGALTKLGIATPGELLSPDEHNAKGYFENSRIVDFHNRLLAKLGSSWCDPTPLAPSWIGSPVGQAATAELEALLVEEIMNAPAFIVKDPRLCRLLPIWRTALDRLGCDVKTILPVRHPLEVARSIHSRNRLSLVRAQMLWLQYVLSAEKATRDLPRAVVLYDRLLEDWRDSLRKAASDIDLIWPRDFDRIGHEIDEFLTEGLKHQRSIWPESRTPLDELCFSVWSAYERLNRMPDDPQAVEALDDVAQRVEKVFAITGPLLKAEIEWNDAHQTEIAGLREQNKTMEARSLALRIQLSDMRAKVQSLQVKLAKQVIPIEREILEKDHIKPVVANAENAEVSNGLHGGAPMAATPDFLHLKKARTTNLQDYADDIDDRLQDMDSQIRELRGSATRMENIMNTRFVALPRSVYRLYRQAWRVLGRS